jgi:RNA polymerase sigma-70 factor (ECF subfamily)
LHSTVKAHLSNPRYSEEGFVAILLARDAASFAIIYDSFSAALYGVILKVVQNEELAGDVLQESFVKIWEKSASYDASKGRLFTWMLNIARNTAIDATRSKHVKVASKIRNIDDNVNMLNRQRNVSQHVESIGVQEIVAKLSPEQKIIIDMMYFQGFSQDEVSKELGIPLGTVKTRARAALIKLRETFNIQLS